MATPSLSALSEVLAGLSVGQRVPLTVQTLAPHDDEGRSPWAS